MMRLVLAAALTSCAGAAIAENLPRFDVETECRKVASVGGSFSEMTYAGCFEMEQQAYDLLKEMWPEMPASVRTECLKIARFGGAGSYMTLQGCAEMEMAAAAENPMRKFRY